MYVQISKDRLKSQAKVDVPKDMDMCTKVKQLGTNMWKQSTIILRPFLYFVDCFKILNGHNMLAFMLDPWFKDLSLMGDHVGHVSIIEIIVAYMIVPTSNLWNFVLKLHGWSNVSSNVGICVLYYWHFWSRGV